MGTEALVNMVDRSLMHLKREQSQNKKHNNSKEKMSELQVKLPQLRQLFELHCKVGEGTFSNVYLATFREAPQAKFAVKHLIPTCHPSRVIKELKCLQEIGGVDNVVGLCMCLRVNDCVTFIMPYQQHDRFSSYVCDMNIEEIRLYMRELCVALRRVHSFGVIHRDVKPGNFLYCRSEKRFLLVDFGLAQKVGEWNETSAFNKKRKRGREDENDLPELAAEQNAKRICYKDRNIVVKRAPLHPCNDNISFVRSIAPQLTKDVRPQGAGGTGVEGGGCKKCDCDGRPQVCTSCLSRKGGTSAPRAGTPGFRAPEVLLKSHDQTTAVDMWAVGVILLCILSRTYPFFRAPDDVTALAELITTFGSEQVKAVANKLGRRIVCSEVCQPLELSEVCSRLRSGKTSDGGILPPPPPGAAAVAAGAPPGAAAGGQQHQQQEEEELMRSCHNKTSAAAAAAGEDLEVPQSAYHLLSRLLELDHTQRITAQEVLSHPFITASEDFPCSLRGEE